MCLATAKLGMLLSGSLRHVDTPAVVLAPACRMPPVHLLLLAFLIWFVVNTYLFPPKPK